MINKTYDYVDLTFNNFISKVFITLSLGLFITAITSFATFSFLIKDPMLFSLVPFAVILQIGITLFFSFRLNKMKVITAKICFALYSILTGITFSTLLVSFDITTLAYCFLITASVFISMAIIGYRLGANFLSFGPYLYAGIFGMVIITILNIFIKSNGISTFLLYGGVILFLGFIAYDVNKIKEFYYLESNVESRDKIMIYGAFILYLDFVNLFIRILRIFGRGGRGRK